MKGMYKTDNLMELGFTDHAETDDDYKPLYLPEPVCCCAHGGKPYMLNGQRVRSRNAGCRVHVLALRYVEEMEKRNVRVAGRRHSGHKGN
jgi:hypothetical protein